MTSRHAVAALVLLAPGIGMAQVQQTDVRVVPAVVSVRPQGVTTAMLTISGVEGYTVAEGLWCGRLVVVLGGGMRCDPATIYGQAPPGGAIATKSGGVLTEVMSVPASVAQRAYEAVLAGQPSRFFYVRRFTRMGRVAASDRYSDPYSDRSVVVTCQLGGGGAGAPFALTNVRLRVEPETPVLFVRRGERPPPLVAEIAYTGTGRLHGRWELVVPGEEQPTPNDLLTEASLPPAERGLQRRYREIERFNVLLLPTGRVTLPGPDPSRLPTTVDGSYTILLRIETAADPFSDVRIATDSGAARVVHNGAVAGFPMPTLRYIVGSGRTRPGPPLTPRTVRLRFPGANAIVSPDSALTLRWAVERGGGRHRVEIERVADGVNMLSAIVAQGTGAYDVPPFVLAGGIQGGSVRWRVVAIDAGGREVGRSEWRRVQQRPRP